MMLRGLTLAAKPMVESDMTINVDELLEAFQIANTGGWGIENTVYLCRQTGKTYWQSDLSDLEEDELPDDIEDGSKYIQVPDKKRLDLGKTLVFDFAREVLPDDYDNIRDFLGRRGGYRKFRALVERRRVLDLWYKFEEEATHKALRAWCAENRIELTERPPLSSQG
jgi:hypothetical protein